MLGQSWGHGGGHVVQSQQEHMIRMVNDSYEGWAPCNNLKGRSTIKIKVSEVDIFNEDLLGVQVQVHPPLI